MRHFSQYCYLVLTLFFFEIAFANSYIQDLTFDEFISKVEENEEVSKPPMKHLSSQLGKILYMPIGWIRSGQIGFTFDNIKDELIEREEKLFYKNSSLSKPFKHDKNKSLLSWKRRLKGLLTPYGVTLIDGHHRMLLSLFMGAKTVPIEIVGDYSHMTEKDFLEFANTNDGILYLRDHRGGVLEKPPRFSKMFNIKNLYLARIIKKKIFASTKLSTSGSSYPVWLKSPSTKPFVEYVIAEVLFKSGIEYDPKWKGEVPKKVEKRIRKVLTKEQDNYIELQSVVVFSKRRHIDYYNLMEIVEASPLGLSMCIYLLNH